MCSKSARVEVNPASVPSLISVLHSNTSLLFIYSAVLFHYYHSFILFDQNLIYFIYCVFLYLNKSDSLFSFLTLFLFFP